MVRAGEPEVWQLEPASLPRRTSPRGASASSRLAPSLTRREARRSCVQKCCTAAARGRGIYVQRSTTSTVVRCTVPGERKYMCRCVVSEIAFLPRSRSSHIIVYKSTHLYVIICLERDLGERDLEPEGCRDRVPSATEIHASVCTFCMFTMQ